MISKNKVQNNKNYYAMIKYVVLCISVIVMFLGFCYLLSTNPLQFNKTVHEINEVPVNFTVKMETKDKIILLDRNEFQEVK